MNTELTINTTQPSSIEARYEERDSSLQLKHGDRVKFAHPRRADLWLFGTVGTIAGYAIQNYWCPLEAIARAKRNGESTDPWINQECTMITNDTESYERKIDSYRWLKDGDRVCIEGRLGTVKFRGDYSDMATIILDNTI